MNREPALRLQDLPATFGATVGALHTVAERIVAPARKPQNEIALTATPGGFGTPEFEHAGELQQVRVEGAELVHRAGEREQRAPLTTLRAARELLGDLLPPDDDGDAELAVDPAAAFALGAFYGFAEAVLSELVEGAAPEDAATPPTLWPEHFDIAIELGEEPSGHRANYGASPGDAEHAEPYFYVGPWTAEVSGELWRATGFRGAELGYSELVAEPDPHAAALAFFSTRRAALTGSDA